MLGGAAVLAIGVFGSAGYLQVRHVQRSKVLMEESSREGGEYGKEHSQAECMEEANRRGRACADAECRQTAGFFVFPCLAQGRHSSVVCNGVPKSMLSWHSWSSSACEDEKGHDGEVCRTIELSRAQFCSLPPRKAR